RQFDSKVAIVTGSGSGIGRATCLAFARAGARLVMADIDEKNGNDTLAMVKEAGGQGVFIRADVSKVADGQAIVNKAVDAYGRLDYAQNNAGIDGAFSTITDSTEENWEHVIGVNLKSVWAGMKYEIPQMIKSGGGAIVNTASVAALVGF